MACVCCWAWCWSLMANNINMVVAHMVPTVLISDWNIGFSN